MFIDLGNIWVNLIVNILILVEIGALAGFVLIATMYVIQFIRLFCFNYYVYSSDLSAVEVCHLTGTEIRNEHLEASRRQQAVIDDILVKKRQAQQV